MTLGLGIKPRKHWWEASTAPSSPLHHPCSILHLTKVVMLRHVSPYSLNNLVLASLFDCENVKKESEEEEEEQEEQGEDEQEGDDVIVEEDEVAKEHEEGDKKQENEWEAEEEKVDTRERGDGQVSVTIIIIDL